MIGFSSSCYAFTICMGFRQYMILIALYNLKNIIISNMLIIFNKNKHHFHFFIFNFNDLKKLSFAKINGII